MNTEERLLHLMEKLEAKEKDLVQLNERKTNITQAAKRLKGEISALKEEIRTADRDNLGEFLEQNGIAFDDVRAAVKNGTLKKSKPEASSEKSESSSVNKQEVTGNEQK